MSYYKAQATLLRRHSLGEADRILTVLSAEHGKLKLVAKGVRRGKSKLAGHLEPFIVTNLHIAKGRNLDVITSARGQRYYQLASGDLTKLALSHLLLEICDKVLPEAEPHPEAFYLLTEVLEALEQDTHPALVRHYFYVRLLDALGHRPQIDAELDGSAYYLLLESGQLTKSRGGEDSAPMKSDSIKLWRLMYSNPLKQIARITSAVEIAQQAQPAIERFYDYQFGVRFSSETVLT